jgi:hypothetical protein
MVVRKVISRDICSSLYSIDDSSLKRNIFSSSQSVAVTDLFTSERFEQIAIAADSENSAQVCITHYRTSDCNRWAKSD